MRNMIIESLTETIEKLIYIIVNVHNLWSGASNLIDISTEVNFNDYNSPSWETQAQILISMYKAGIISLQSVIEELYGDDKEEEWKKEEVERILAKNNIKKKEDGEQDQDEETEEEGE